jgi:hypothetical protein
LFSSSPRTHVSACPAYCNARATAINRHTLYQYTFNEIKIHVLSSSELRTQELDQINGIITIALFIFTEIEAIKLIYNWYKNAPDDKNKLFEKLII